MRTVLVIVSLFVTVQVIYALTCQPGDEYNSDYGLCYTLVDIDRLEYIIVSLNSFNDIDVSYIDGQPGCMRIINNNNKSLFVPASSSNPAEFLSFRNHLPANVSITGCSTSTPPSTCNRNRECEPALGENTTTCIYDCAVCGDGICTPSTATSTDKDEDRFNCGKDCGGYCGDGVCGLNTNQTGAETAQNCNFDCGSEGDGICGNHIDVSYYADHFLISEYNENCATSPDDCGECPSCNAASHCDTLDHYCAAEIAAGTPGECQVFWQCSSSHVCSYWPDYPDEFSHYSSFYPYAFIFSNPSPLGCYYQSRYTGGVSCWH